jgi:hypothetical protein
VSAKRDDEVGCFGFYVTERLLSFPGWKSRVNLLCASVGTGNAVRRYRHLFKPHTCPSKSQHHSRASSTTWLRLLSFPCSYSSASAPCTPAPARLSPPAPPTARSSGVTSKSGQVTRSFLLPPLSSDDAFFSSKGHAFLF